MPNLLKIDIQRFAKPAEPGDSVPAGKVGENSYITVEEADELLRVEPGAERWAALDENKKSEYLTTAARRMEARRFTGRKHSLFQEMAFPRDGRREVPAAVKQAQALEALALTDSQAQTRPSPQNQEVLESRGGKGRTMASSKAETLLRPYLLESAVIV